MTEDPHLEVPLHPNPAYITMDSAVDALQPHAPGSHGSHDYENVSIRAMHNM